MRPCSTSRLASTRPAICIRKSRLRPSNVCERSSPTTRILIFLGRAFHALLAAYFPHGLRLTRCASVELIQPDSLRARGFAVACLCGHGHRDTRTTRRTCIGLRHTRPVPADRICRHGRIFLPATPPCGLTRSACPPARRPPHAAAASSLLFPSPRIGPPHTAKPRHTHTRTHALAAALSRIASRIITHTLLHTRTPRRDCTRPARIRLCQC